jgi:hypothetical protein
MRTVLFASLLLAALVASANAQSCENAGSSVSACSSATTTGTADYNAEPCAWNIDTQMCFTPIPSCVAIQTDTYCAAHPSCIIDTSAAVGSRCKNLVRQLTTEETCGLHGVFDIYNAVPLVPASARILQGDTSSAGATSLAAIGRSETTGFCYATRSEANSAFDCSHWANYADSHACTSHSCVYTASSMGAPATCKIGVTVATQPVGIITPNVEIDVCYKIDAQTFSSSNKYFSFNVSIPFADFYSPSKPTWYSVIMGHVGQADNTDDGTIGYTNYLSDSDKTQKCSTINMAHDADTLIPPSTFSDPVTLQNYFTSVVGTTKSMGFDETSFGSPAYASASMYNPYVAAIVGSWKSGSDSNSVSTAASYVNGANPKMVLSFKTDIVSLANSCGATVTKYLVGQADINGAAYADDTQVYSIPVSILTRTDGKQFAVATQEFKASVTVSGSVSFSAASSSAASVTNHLTFDTKCAHRPMMPSQHKRTAVIRETYASPDTTRVTGIQFHDVSVSDCFGSTITSVSDPMCGTNAGLRTCYTDITFVTQCVDDNTQGDSLDVCPAGTAYANGNHIIKNTPRSWIMGAYNSATAQYAGASGDVNSPDVITVTINVSVYGDADSGIAQVDGQLVVLGGFLPSPMSHVPYPSTSTAHVVVGDIEIKNGNLVQSAELSSKTQLTVAIFFDKAEMMDSVALNINTNKVVITAIDDYGTAIYSGSSIHWLDIARYLLRTVRSESKTSLVATIDDDLKYLGVDGFSIEVLDLLNVWTKRTGQPAPPGFTLNIGWQATYSPTVSTNNRRLLGLEKRNVLRAPRQLVVATNGGTKVLSFKISRDAAETTYNPPDSGSTPTSGTMHTYPHSTLTANANNWAFYGCLIIAPVSYFVAFALTVLCSSPK